MIKLELSKKKWVALISDDVGSQVRTMDILSFQILGEEGTKLLMSPIIRYLNGRGFISQLNHLQIINLELGNAIKQWNLTSLPNNESAWQDLVIRLYELVLQRKNSKMSLKSRVFNWNRIIQPLLCILRDAEDVIPISVEIPKAKDSLTTTEMTSYRDQLLGQRSPEPVTGKIDKLLVDISLSRSDAKYLDMVKDLLAYRRRIVHDSLLAWWRQIQMHYEYGQRLLNEVDPSALKNKLDESDAWINGAESRQRTQKHGISGATDSSLGEVLWILTNEHDGECSTTTLSTSKHLPCYQSLKFPPSIPPAISSVPRLERINWMLGNLSKLDIAICSALLIMHNPVFTPHSLFRAKIYDKDGKPYLEVGNRGHLFRIEKARAKAMKESVLDDLSFEIIETILRMTARVRARFEAQQSSTANLLFILHHKGRHGPPDMFRMTSKLSGRGFTKRKRMQSFMDYFPALGESGLVDGSVSFSKIRATEGVMEWFRTGSITAMTKKLGNTEKVVLGHYLPKPLIAAWNTRLIRRFQNLWITIAAGNEDFLLEVTDFPTLEELHAFIIDMLMHHAPSSSPLAEELHRRFFNLSKADDNSETNYKQTDGSLTVPISSNTIAILYLYREFAFGVNPVTLDRPDAITGLRPRQFVDLAELLRNQLPDHRDSIFRRAHEEALSLVDKLRSSVHWGDLLMKSGGSYDKA